MDPAYAATSNCGMGHASGEGGGRIEEVEDGTCNRGPYPSVAVACSDKGVTRQGPWADILVDRREVEEDHQRTVEESGE